MTLSALATSPPHRVLVIQLRRLGDVVLTTALLSDLRRAAPEAALEFLTEPATAPLLASHPLLAHVHAREDTAALARALRARRFDWVVDAQGSTTSALLTRATGARVRAGWDVPVKRFAYTHRLPRTERHEYVARERQRLLELLGVPVGPPTPTLALTPEEREAGERMLDDAGAPPDRARVALLLSTREPVKTWSVERYAWLARAVAREGATPVLIEAPGDAPHIARVRQVEPRAAPLPPLALRALMAVLAACDVLVSGDTGPAHLADALRVPRVTIFGPTDPVAWCPPIPTAIALRGPGPIVSRMKDRGRVPGETPDAVPASAALDAVRTLLVRAPRWERDA